MFILIAIVIGVIFIFLPTVRCAVLHPFSVVKNAFLDAALYVRHKQKNNCRTGELVAYTGLFGKGKTLSAVHRVVKSYKLCNDKPVWCPRRQKMVTQKIKVLSNVELNIPYERFESLKQMVYCAEQNAALDDENDTLTVTLVLGDEFSVQMNSRNFKSNIDPLFLNTLLTCRHFHMSLYYTAQRFGHVDALLRQVTSVVICCDKLWRFQRQNYYDAWEMENATSASLLTPKKKSCWFVHNSDYAAYDTLATVGNLSRSCESGDMLTADEILALQQNTPANMEVVSKPSRSYRHKMRKLNK